MPQVRRPVEAAAAYARLAEQTTYSGQAVNWDDAVAKGPDEMPPKFAFDPAAELVYLVDDRGHEVPQEKALLLFVKLVCEAETDSGARVALVSG